jgi:hypothetical protein
MALVYAYLAAWVIGGVLLGARILLVQHASAPALPRATPFVAASLLGFGLFGLVAEGLGLASGSWAAGWALAGSALFLGAAYGLRERAVQASGSEA